jgi:energy-coupling factor transporter ATP-binding protein EcfA2
MLKISHQKAPLLPPAPTRTFSSHPATDRPARPQQRHNIRGILKTENLLMLAGASGSGKSTVVMDMFQRMARRMEWQGLETQATGIFVCCAEAPAEFESLEDAWLLRHNLAPATNIFYMNHGFDLDNSEEVEAFIAHVRHQRAVHGIVFDVMVFDTTVDFMGSVEENSNSGLRRINGALTYIAQELGVAIILIHHFGKDESRGPRGGTALNAKIDARLDCWSEGNNTFLSIAKLRSGPKGRVFTFQRESEIVGVDSFGRPTTAGVVIALPDGAPATNAGNNLPVEITMIDLVRSAAPKPLPWTDVRESLAELGLVTNDAERKAAERLRDRLAKAGVLVYGNGTVFPGPKMPSKAVPNSVAPKPASNDAVNCNASELARQVDLEEAIAAVNNNPQAAA